MLSAIMLSIVILNVLLLNELKLLLLHLKNVLNVILNILNGRHATQYNDLSKAVKMCCKVVGIGHRVSVC